MTTAISNSPAVAHRPMWEARAGSRSPRVGISRKTWQMVGEQRCERHKLLVKFFDMADGNRAVPHLVLESGFYNNANRTEWRSIILPEYSGQKFSSSGNMECVQLYRGGQITDIPCRNLVFAAGAWTPRLFAELFPNSDVASHPTTNSANWIIVKSLDEPSVQNIG